MPDCSGPHLIEIFRGGTRAGARGIDAFGAQHLSSKRKPGTGAGGAMQRFAYIGTGWWGMELARNSVPLKDMIEIAGCCTLVEKEAAAFHAQFGGKIYPRYEDALSDPAVDAVLLATPHSLHWTQIIAAAKAKKHVFVEKPLALTVETGQQAVKAVEDAHLTLGIGHNRRYSQVARKMKEMVDSGAVG